LDLVSFDTSRPYHPLDGDSKFERGAVEQSTADFLYLQSGLRSSPARLGVLLVRAIISFHADAANLISSHLIFNVSSF
jgi:hypothetical protein